MCKLKKMSNIKKEGDKGDSGKGEAPAAQPAAAVTEHNNLSTEAAAAEQQPKRKKQPKAVALTLDDAAVGKAGRRPRVAAAAPVQQSGGEHCKLPYPQSWSLFTDSNEALVLRFVSARVCTSSGSSSCGFACVSVGHGVHVSCCRCTAL